MTAPDTPERDTPELDTLDPHAERTPEQLEAFAAKLREYITPSTKIDGWNGPRQQRFLEAIADGETVVDACRCVQLSAASAYAFRRRPAGRAFDLGWKAADLLARERVAANLMLRSLQGQTVEITRADGSTVTRHHFDNRLAVQMLNRLDRYADASERTAPGHAARLVAADFDSYLSVIGEEGGPARAGLFMLAREGCGGDGETAELEPVLALARADRIIRCGTAAGDIIVADLDPARRAEWTAEQWARAEAAGVVVLAPAPKPEPKPAPAKPEITCQPVSTSDPFDAPDSPIWFDEDANTWRTNFPPPADFAGNETGDWSDHDYERDLSDEEKAALNLADPDPDEELAEAEAERDVWIAACVAFAKAQAAAAEADASPEAPGEEEQEEAEHAAPPPVDRAHTSGD